MIPIATQVAQALEDSLKVITIENGYFTDLGKSVYRGFYAHAIQGRNTSYPLIAVQPDTETVAASRDAAASKIDASIRLSVITDDADIPADVLRSCAADVRRALAMHLAEKLRALGVHTPGELGTVEFATAGDSHLSLAAISVAFTFIEKYEA
jgi:hypothetical protein